LYLTDDEKKMRDGQLGEAVSMAMSILADLGEAIDAPEMVEITHVHTDSGFYLGDAGLEFVWAKPSMHRRWLKSHMCTRIADFIWVMPASSSLNISPH
jgi:predicted aconitase